MILQTYILCILFNKIDLTNCIKDLQPSCFVICGAYNCNQKTNYNSDYDGKEGHLQSDPQSI